MTTFPLVQNDTLRPFLKILTDYPRDDLASDEVHQSLIAACATRNIDSFALDVGAIPSMDTVVAGFKTAQLACNSQLGYGHIIHTNCAPRRNMVSKKSKGEGIVIGMLNNGAALVTVNSGHSLAPFYDQIKSGDAVFFSTHVPDAGSQFRSRDYFPAALADLAIFLTEQYTQLGADKINSLLSENKMSEILDGFALLNAALTIDDFSEIATASILYIDNFGNIKLNLSHDDLLNLYPSGTELVLSIAGTVSHATVGEGGFSQGEGILALTRGSSGWGNTRFTEIFLRGGTAAGVFPRIQTGEQVLAVPAKTLQKTISILRESGLNTLGNFDLYMLSEAKLMDILAHKGLIKDGFNSTGLQQHIDQGDLIDVLSNAQTRVA